MSEIDRILCLDQDFRVPEDKEGLASLIRTYTERLRKPGGTWDLFPVQALALAVAEENRGLLASIAVGGGKSLIGSLLPKVLGIRPFKTVIFTRAKLIDSWYREQARYAEHFQIERNLYVLSYAKLSHPDEGPVLLDKLAPDLVIADEAHALKSKDSCRRSRFERYFEDNPETIFVAMSGTLTKTSILDYEHLAEIALKGGTPLPRSSKAWSDLNAWAACLDPEQEGTWAAAWQWGKVQPLNTVYGDGRKLMEIKDLTERRMQARAAYYERLRTTPGVVHTKLDTVGATLEIELITDVKVPLEVKEALARADVEYLLPNGDEIEDPLHKARAMRQIAQGVYYIWDWPGAPDIEWLRARRDKSREIRRAIKDGPREIDSPALVVREMERGDQFERDIALQKAWESWLPHKHKDPPPTVPRWLSEYLVDDVIRRARKWRDRPPAIIWYEHRFVAERLQEKGVDVYWPEEPRNPETADPRDGAIALSISSHTEGLNMQHLWRRMIVLSPPSDGGTWEQLIGRVHREGQEADSVQIEIYAHVPVYVNALREARKRATFINQANGQQQKLLIANWIKEI